LKHDFARRLRRDQTAVERKLWYALRDRRLYGFKFRRQQPIGSYVVDFVCFEEKLIVELDGGQHGFDEKLAADAARTAYLQNEGFRVMRYWNSELVENLDGAMEGICRELGVQ
jgi:adenine-specific DNA-methyltransferase